MQVRGAVACLAVVAAIAAGTGQVGAEIYDGPTLTPTTESGESPHVISNLPITVSDGTELLADVYLPSSQPGRRWPVMVSMTPYVRPSGPGSYFERSGRLARVAVSVRGTGGSGGTLCLLCDREQQDLAEVITWAADQPWSTGRVATIGSSYPAILGLLAAAKQPRGLSAVVAERATHDVYRDAVWHNGMFSANFVAQWTGYQAATGWREANPWTFDEAAQNKIAALEARSREWDGDFYRERAVYPKYDRIVAPTLILDGWRDGFARGALENFRGIASRHKRLRMDPFGHHYGSSTFEPATEYDDVAHCANEGAFALGVRWLERFLLDVPNGVEEEPAAEWFDMGSRTWHTAPTWPPPNAQVHALHLSGARSGSASSVNDGSLTGPAPTESVHQAPDTIVHDPASGTSETFSKWGEVAATLQMPMDQSVDQATGLTFTTAPLPSPLRLAGPMELRLWSSTTAPDMDWVVKVSKVESDRRETQLDGTIRSTLMTSGYMRSSHRAVDDTRSRPGAPWITNDGPTPVPLNEAVEHRIDIWPVAWTLDAGERLRVTISTADAPSHEVYPVPAVNTVRHDPSHPSRLLITTLPAERPHAQSCTS